ncbi:hypothetical protein V8E51_015363 [Hyaloscypha variabilis]
MDPYQYQENELLSFDFYNLQEDVLYGDEFPAVTPPNYLNQLTAGYQSTPLNNDDLISGTGQRYGQFSSDFQGLSPLEAHTLSSHTHSPSNVHQHPGLVNSLSPELPSSYQSYRRAQESMIVTGNTWNRLGPSELPPPNSPLSPLQKPLSHLKEQIPLQSDGACSVILRGLPKNTTEDHLRSLLAWSDEYLSGTILSQGSNTNVHFCAAQLKFSTFGGAEKARSFLHGRQNIKRDATMEMEIITDASLGSRIHNPPPAEGSMPRKNARHKFSPQDKIYLEKQFSANPYPTLEDRAKFAAHLSVSEKPIHTWFNNTRQRQDAAQSVPANSNVPLSRKSLEKLSLLRSSTMSPIERFAAVPPGSHGEPGIELIEAAIKERLRMGIKKYTSESAYSSFAKDDSFQSIWSDEDVEPDSESESPHSIRDNSKSSRSHSSAFSSASNASIHFRRKNKMAKRRSSKTRTTPAAITTTGNAAQRSSANRARRVNRKTPSRRIQSVFLKFQCAWCHTIFECKILVQYLAVITSVTCPKCRSDLGTYGRNDSSGTAFLPLRVTVLCRRCTRRSILTVRTETVHLAVEGAPAGHATITYSHNCYREEAFDVLIRQGEIIRYHCTFCSVNFQSKYAWERHESASHEPRVAWICCKTTVDRIPNLGICLFCSDWLPPEDHFATKHKIRECKDQGLCNRVFFRKDQLAQHVRHFHRAPFSRDMHREWMVHIDLSEKRWCCGVCGAIFHNWKERAKHIGGHWEEGLDMKSWKIQPEDSRTAEDLELQDRDHTLNRMNKANGIRQPPDPVGLPSHRTRGTVSRFFSKIKRMLPRGSDVI